MFALVSAFWFSSPLTLVCLRAFSPCLGVKICCRWPRNSRSDFRIRSALASHTDGLASHVAAKAAQRSSAPARPRAPSLFPAPRPKNAPKREPSLVALCPLAIQGWSVLDPAIEGWWGTEMHGSIIRGWLDMGIHRTPSEGRVAVRGYLYDGMPLSASELHSPGNHKHVESMSRLQTTLRLISGLSSCGIPWFHQSEFKEI